MPDTDELNDIRDICSTLPRRVLGAGHTLGLPGRAVWLTPACEPILSHLDRARALAKEGGRIAEEPRYSTIADTVWEYLGLSQYAVDTCLVAAVTKLPIRSLFALPPGPGGGAVMGPSVIEGGTHTRWRHWPEDYGKTYQLYSGKDDAGLAEAVRRPLALEEVDEFIYLGKVTKEYDEGSAAFAQAIGAVDRVADILRRLHAITCI
jgi:hypothetical protein